MSNILEIEDLLKKYYKKEEEVLADVDGNIIIMSDGAALITGEHYGKIKTDNGWVELTYSPDLDNCIPITDEEYFSDDIVVRFIEFVKAVYGADTLEENLDFIANALGNKGDTSREVIRNYFLKDFYADHLKVYQKRPIYWLFDSGKQNGFKALIYMHRYEADTVGRVRTDYLHRAQKYVETAMQSAQYTIDNASSASEKSKATKAVTKYTKQLAEMKIYDEAIAHIAKYGTKHSECIVTRSLNAAKKFQQQVDAAAVYVNASTRFTDGGEFGYGAEIGISTQKLHARGPMGLHELTTVKYLINGDGQIR